MEIIWCMCILNGDEKWNFRKQVSKFVIFKGSLTAY